MQSLNKTRKNIFSVFIFGIPLLLQAHQNITFPVEKKITVTDSFKNFIELVVVKAKQRDAVESLSESLCNCYERIMHGKSTLLVQDLVGAYPHLMQEFQDVIQITKAPRPGGTVVNPPVGPIVACNIQEISDTLSNISTIYDFCCAALQQDFESTWTFIEEIQNSLSGTTTISIVNTLSVCCSNITNNFITTWTVLEDFEQSIITDFSGVFTTIQDIVDNIDSVTVFVDFSPLYTTINEIDSTLNSNFDGTFTALQDLKNSITECCPDFDGTFTVLLDIENTITTNFDGTFTMLEAILNNGSSDTFTALEDILATITINFDGTFTALEDIKNTLTECCAEMQQNFEDTWTILADINETIIDNFDGTFTVIANLVFSGTVVVDVTDVYTVLSAGFDGTFTALADLKSAFTQISFLGTLTTLEKLTECSSTPLSDGTDITDPGYYCLANDVVGSFTITADNVVLDLNNYTISNGGIFVLTGTNRTIRNGKLINSMGGIALTANANTTIEYLSIINPTTIAITSTGGSSDTMIDHIVIENGTGGIACVNDSNVQIAHVSITTMSSFGMSFTANTNLSIHKVAILNTGGDGIDMTDPMSVNVREVSIYNATFAGIIVYGTALGCNLDRVEITNANMEYGINLNNPLGCQITNCSIANIGSAPFANPIIGINLAPSAGYNLIQGCTVKNINSTAGPTGIFVRCLDTTVRDCIVQSIVGAAGDTSGYRITGSSSSCWNCSADTITNSGAANNGSAYGFFLGENIVRAVECTALNISIAAIPNTVAGFGIFERNIDCVDCAVNTINCPISDSTDTLGGFLIDSAGYNSFLKNCSVLNADSHSFCVSATTVLLIECTATRSATNGFNILSANPNQVSLVECTAIANNNGFVLPVGNTNPVYHCYAGNNAVSNFVNVPNAQLPNAAMIAGSNVRRTSP